MQRWVHKNTLKSPKEAFSTQTESSFKKIHKASFLNAENKQAETG